MPEGDVVWRTARSLRRALAGHELTGSDLRVPALATADLSGRRVLDVLPRGKHLLLRVDPDLTLHSHLRMDGSWHLYQPGGRWTAGPAHEVRVVLTTASLVAVGHRVHDLALVPTADEDRLVGHLGPDLLGPGWDVDEALGRLAADGGRAVGEALMDQRNLAGAGNLYKSETLFLAGLSPWLAVADVPDLRALVERTRRLMHANLQRAAQATTGDTRHGRRTWVYGRARQPCRRCGTPVQVAEQGDPGTERLTYWCPSCQPGPQPGRTVALPRRTFSGRSRRRR